MATVTDISTGAPDQVVPPRSPNRLFTAADMVAMPEYLPSGSVSYELHHGRLVPMSPPGASHGNLQARLAAEFYIQGDRPGHGKVYTEVGVVLARKPDHVYGPDVVFVMQSSLPAKISPEGFLESIPELIVEIKSKNDTAAEVAEKVADYLRAGGRLVWVCDDAKDVCTEHRPDQLARTIDKNGVLTCDDIIPGFQLSLADLFRD